MDIKQLYDKLQSQIKASTLQLNKSTTGAEAFDRLCALFGLKEIFLQDTACSLNELSLELSGEFDISEAYANIHMKMSVACDGRIGAEFSAAGLCLDSAGFFCAENCVIKITLLEGQADFREEIEGTLTLGSVKFHITGQRKEECARRQLKLQTEERIDASSFLNEVLSPMKVDLFSFGIDREKKFAVETCLFLYTASSGWLTFGECKEDRRDDALKLDVGTNIGFSFQDMLGFSNLGFAVEKYGSEYDFMLKGELNLFGSDLQFVLCYGEEMFSISAVQCELAQLESVEDMGKLVGERHILENFPQGFNPGNILSLLSMNLMVSPDFKSIEKFDIAVLLDVKWGLCASPRIEVSDILISFGYTPYEKQFGITGSICFCGVDTQLTAGLVIQEETGKKEWLFGWQMYEDETVSLTEFIGRLAVTLGIASTSVRLPDIRIAHVAVRYAAGTFSIRASILVTGSKLFSSETKISITSEIKDEKRGYSADFSWKSRNDALTIADVLTECGVEEGIGDVPEFIRNIGLKSVELSYDFTENKITAEIDVAGIGGFCFHIFFGKDGSYDLTFLPQITSLSFADLPVVGGLVEQYLKGGDSFGVSDITLLFRSKADQEGPIPAGLRLSFVSMGKERSCQLYEKPEPAMSCGLMGTNQADSLKTAWIDMNKTVAVFTLHRLGVGLDGSHFVLMLDASLAVTPLTFQLTGAGIGIDFMNPSDLKFYISGFSAAFKNDLVSIAGGFEKNGGNYTGMLLIHVKQITVNAIAEYSQEGSLMAYAVVTANFGGPPVFFITGVAFGFGYNKKLILPTIENVAAYPLITAAKGNMDQGAMVKALDSYLVTEKGQSFLAAGICFSSFGVIDSIAVLTVSFGNNFEIGLLGLSDVTMPPHCVKNPVAHAQLALKAAVLPNSGLVSVEARLTSESYILSRDCKLTGGFAFYYWFGGEHSGDMVITLGGYRADYQKPEHYPDVPRVGFDWNIDRHLNVSGEIYFALTPREVMVGGRLSAVYTLGKLKAYFIAAADFYLGWKPFHYAASIRVLMGVSCRVDFLFVHHTFTVELGAGLSIWGPDFTGTAHISWFIISFDIGFGGNASKTPEKVEWDDFVQSFLPKKEGRAKTGLMADDAGQAAPLMISFTEGILSAEESQSKEPVRICRADGLTLQVESAIPVTAVSINHLDKEEDIGQTAVSVCPMEYASLANDLEITITDELNNDVNVQTKFVRQNLPTALWGTKECRDTLVRDVICGVQLIPKPFEYVLFPKINVISLEQLYLNGTIYITDAFASQTVTNYPVYSEKNSIEIFASTADDDAVKEKRKALLRSMGVDLEMIQDISLKHFAANAENLLTENILVKAGYGEFMF